MMNKRKSNKKITIIKYKQIVDEWFTNDFNGAKAYRKFYKNVKKDETATVNFSKIKALPEIEEYIKDKFEIASKKIELTHEGLLQELKNWLESDITETISLTEEEIKALPAKLRRFISKYKIRESKDFDRKGNLLNETKTIELSFLSKERAAEMIAKHIGFYENDNKQKIPQINYDSLNEDILLKIWDARNSD